MRPDLYAGMADGRELVLSTLAECLAPPPEITVAQWADQHRHVSAESGSPYAGKWRNALIPYAVEVQEVLSFHHPCTEVVFKKSHQIGGTEIGVNLIGYCIDQEPCPILVVLPTIDEGSKYERAKLAPTIKATPRLRHKVKTEKSRARDGSTVTFKRFVGGYAQITGANSSAGLQMISVRVLVGEEISEWPETTGSRGDPLAQAEKRLTAWSHRGVKKYYSSTPDLKGVCRIDAKWEKSDQRRFYVPCPSCGDYQVLKWDHMRWRSDEPPHQAYMVCASRGCVIEHFQKRAMVAEGRWVKTYCDDGAEPDDVIVPDRLDEYLARPSKGRQPGFHIWQAYSPFVSWDQACAEHLEAEGKPQAEKVFVQQVLGEAYEETGDAPDHEKLFMRREPYELGAIPAGGLVLTGMADVQVNRIEWAVYAWGIGMTGWLIDKGIVEGDPATAETWKRFEPVVYQQYQNHAGRVHSIEAFGIDSGYLSNWVYLFARGHERVFATDGRAGHLHPFIGTPKRVSVTNLRGKKLKAGVMLWPIGTWPLKSNVYAALRKTIKGPDPSDGHWQQGALHFPDACDEAFFKQITAEYLAHTERGGRPALEWKVSRGQANEQLDIVVGARAMAAQLGLDRYTTEKWRELASQRGAPPEAVQRDLAEFWAPSAARVTGKRGARRRRRSEGYDA